MRRGDARGVTTPGSGRGRSRFSSMRLLAVARKEWIQLRRDRRSMTLAFVLPLLLLLFFGYAISLDVDEIGIAVLDRDHSMESRALVEAFQSSGYFRVEGYVESEREVEEGLVRGAWVGALVIPYRAETVQLLLDGADANTATIALNYADAIVAQAGTEGAAHPAAGGGTAASVGGIGGRVSAVGIDPGIRVWYNPTLESRNSIVPALIAVIMSIIAAMLTALTIAREWERGTMEPLAATPVGRAEVVVGKLLPYVGIGIFDVAVAAVAGVVVFGTPFEGSVLTLAPLALLFLVGALGLGIFISASVRSQVLATQVAMTATYLPAVLLSGFIFDIEGMPVVLRGITYLVPARYFVTVTRGVFLKGVGLEVLWPEALLMLAFALVGLGLAIRAFRKEVR